jgi:hypothetical protein
MPAVHFITHPEVSIDPSVPVPDWPLSAVGLRRVELLLERSWIMAASACYLSFSTASARTTGPLYSFDAATRRLHRGSRSIET